MATIADLNLEARALVDADTTSYPAAVLLRRVNQAYEEVVSFILGLDGLWQFDDTNFDDFPIATTTLVHNQPDYTFNSTHLEIERASILDAQGNYQPIYPIDISQIGPDPTELYPDAGFPLYYDKAGKSIILYPAPDSSKVTTALGLKVYFKRTADIFTSTEVTTGTKEPGFASPFHMILAYKAAIPFAISYKPDRVRALQAQVLKFEEEMKKFYGRREQDRRKKMSFMGISFR